jgi:hypothetical protein
MIKANREEAHKGVRRKFVKFALSKRYSNNVDEKIELFTKLNSFFEFDCLRP